MRCTCPLLTQSGHWLCIAAMVFEPLRCRRLSFGGGNETARVHQTFRRRRGGVATCGAGAAGGAGAQGGRADEFDCRLPSSGPTSPHFSKRCSNWAGPSAATCRWISATLKAIPGNSQARGRAGRTGSGRHCYGRRCRDDAAAAGDAHHTDCVQQCRRPGRCRLRQEHGAAGRQRHRLHSVRIQLEREMAGDP